MAEEKATLKQWIAVLGAVLGAFMAVLDVSITNASLQNIQGALSASLDEGSWIATSYLIAEIIVIPLTGWFASIFSIRRYLLVNAALFLFFSMCCAWAWNLPSMIVFRALQGVTGGVLIPMAATIIVSTLPASQRAIGLALFGISATFAPCIGPTIGGWLTINYSWEYIFYLNIIPGIILMAAIAYSMDAKPMQLQLLKKGDWWGIGFMAIALGSLTYILEEGNRKDWFGSNEISYAAVACVVGFIFFFYIEFTRKEPFINLRLLGRRNFALSSILSLSLGLGLYGSVYILPLYLASIQHFDAFQIGKVMMWSGLPQLFITPFIPALLKKFDARGMLVIGVGLFATSCFMNVLMTHDTAADQLKMSLIVRALGQPFIMTPLSTVAYEGIEPKNIGSASGLYNMMRNLGGSLGIGILGSILTTRYQLHFSRIAEAITQIDIQAQMRIQKLTQLFMSKGFGVQMAHDQAIQAIGGTINREAYVMAFSDCFLFMTLAFLIAGTGIFFLRKAKPMAGPVTDH